MLDKTVFRWLGRLVQIQPHYGWGWSNGTGRFVEVPPPFAARLVRLWELDGVTRGGIGCIEEPQFEFDRCWAVFATHLEGIYNFNDRVGHYRIVVRAHEPAPGSEPQ